ncbi:helix-turn-helix transcriptional regulator [Streptosporangium subroseum]|uniref:helix-turn-helix domain-containing protein n=1 Tax=Streptosporangium subroseum TaxID=106412 RepID=UPI003441F4B8
MAPERAPTVRRRKLAGELRRLRELSEKTIEEIAEILGWSIAKVSRIETARVGITSPDLTKLLDLYEVDSERRVTLHALGRTARTRGWWDAYADSLPSDYATYIQLEADTAFIRGYDALTVNGLLQTEEYAEEIIREALMDLSPPAEVQRRVEVRMTRQKLLTREESPLRFQTVIDEVVLSRLIGSSQVMKAQCHKILEIADLPNVSIQILPVSSGAHPASAGTFSVMHFREPHDPDVVYIETMTSSLYVERDTEIHWYTLTLDRLRAAALSAEESKVFIARAAKRFS